MNNPFNPTFGDVNNFYKNISKFDIFTTYQKVFKCSSDVATKFYI